MTDEIDYDQIIQEMREENERQAAEWRKDILKQFEPKGECRNGTCRIRTGIRGV